jgi:hypothetical protein
MTQLGQYTGSVRDALGFLATGDPGSADLFYRRNLPRIGLADSADNAAAPPLVTQVMTSVPIALAGGDLVTNLSFLSGATAAGTPTNWWFALYDPAATPALLFQTADQTTGAWAANTWKTLALSTAYRVAKSGVYWAAIMVKATTVPSLVGCTGARPVLTGERNLAQSSGSALTTTAPSTIATPTVGNFVPLAVAS